MALFTTVALIASLLLLAESTARSDITTNAKPIDNRNSISRRLAELKELFGISELAVGDMIQSLQEPTDSQGISLFFR
ncbi:hypothetical protein AB6A40_005853 [Gnathostoma spinigerum]|uniref:RxLR effector protein n=1 Tax=Gnathostoma spinigerum TaxID=75299 RepID=A0ABD6EPA9_9BILA